MKLFGFELTRRRKEQQILNSVPTGGFWAPFGSLWTTISEPFTGAWQRNVTALPTQNLLAFSAVYACVSGISADVAKMRIKLARNQGGIWKEVVAGEDQSPYLKILQKPNRYQTRIKFIEQWIVSKLLYGNAYILKQREDLRGLVTSLYVLHPNCVKPLVADDGSVYYEINRDYLSEVPDVITVPASEVIHDMMVSLWHPLVGVSPIYACGMAATLGSSIISNSASVFTNKAQPGGMLSAPGRISDDTAARMKRYFEDNYSGANAGRIAVAGDGLKFEQFSLNSVDAQLIQQLKWTVEDVARAFHYPMFKLGGPMPAYASGPHVLSMMYYTDCLQALIESLEICLDEGLELPRDLGTELDIDNLLRMDTAALYEANNKAAGWMKIDEMRFRANLPPVEGGDTPYLQQQNYSLTALAKRDAQEDPFAKGTTPAPAPQEESEEPMASTEARGLDADLTELWTEAELRKDLACV